MINKIIGIIEEINKHEEDTLYKKGTQIIFDDPDFGETEAVIINNPSPHDDTIQIKLKERPMTLWVSRDKIKTNNKDVLI